MLWEFDDQNAKIDTSNVYTPQYLMDIDFDGVPDLLVVHGGDPLKEPGIWNKFNRIYFYNCWFLKSIIYLKLI